MSGCRAQASVTFMDKGGSITYKKWNRGLGRCMYSPSWIRRIQLQPAFAFTLVASIFSIIAVAVLDSNAKTHIALTFNNLANYVISFQRFTRPFIVSRHHAHRVKFPLCSWISTFPAKRMAWVIWVARKALAARIAADSTTLNLIRILKKVAHSHQSFPNSSLHRRTSFRGMRPGGDELPTRLKTNSIDRRHPLRSIFGFHSGIRIFHPGATQ